MQKLSKDASLTLNDLYDRSSNRTDINDARKELFTKRGRAMDAIPPTKAAHTKRVAYQAGHCWGQMLSEPYLPDPGKWGWQKTSTQTWQPLWSKLPEASKTIQEWIKCKDAKKCKYKKSNFRCNELCGCIGTCK